MKEAADVARFAPQGGLLAYQLDRKRLMVFQVGPTPSWFPASILYVPVDNTPPHFDSRLNFPAADVS